MLFCRKTGLLFYKLFLHCTVISDTYKRIYVMYIKCNKTNTCEPSILRIKALPSPLPHTPLLAYPFTSHPIGNHDPVFCAY